MMESIAAAGMSMSQLQFQTAYDTAMVKKSMDCMEIGRASCRERV